MFGHQLIRIDELINELIETARSAVFFCGVSREILKTRY